MLIDRQGRCLRTNRFGLDMMQVPADAVKGKSFREFWPEDVRPQVDAAMQKVLEGSEAAFDAHTIGSERERLFAVKVAPIFDGKGAVAKFISIATDITHRKTAEEERVASYEQRLAMEKRHTREKEHLLMDLHDGIGGIATNISILSAVGREAADVDSMKNTLTSIRTLANEGISEVRSFMHSLDSKELTWRSLATELKYQGTQMVEPHGISFTFYAALSEVNEGPGSLFWVNLFKIYKEAITNVLKHAKADKVIVDLTVSRSGFRLTIQDNGIGWVDRGKIGRGIANIRKRTAQMGGAVTFSNDKGLLIELTMPLHFATVIPE